MTELSSTCKLCSEPLPERALYFANIVAIENRYCSWFCMTSRLGQEKALETLQKALREKNEKTRNE